MSALSTAISHDRPGLTDLIHRAGNGDAARGTDRGGRARMARVANSADRSAERGVALEGEAANSRLHEDLEWTRAVMSGARPPALDIS